MTTIKQERAAITRLIDAFGADVLVNIAPPRAQSRGTRYRVRINAELDATACTACSLCDNDIDGDHRGPFFPSYTTTNNLIVVTAHPTPAKDKYTRLLKSMLSGCDHVDISHIAMVPVVSCVPRAGSVLRHATKAEVTACQANLHRSLDAAEAPNVLFVGKQAMSAWRDDVTLEQMAGITGVWRDTWVVAAIEHPSVARRPGEVKEWMVRSRATVEMLMEGVIAGIGARCLNTKCTEPVFGWDGDGLPWCDKHMNVTKHTRPREYVDVALPLEGTA